ncbi:MAG: AraC family transcriptional regulator [Rhizobium sp.]|nr:AraC family transcriptional regulator [Rhizobium sp.]
MEKPRIIVDDLERRLNTAPLARNLINNMLKAGYDLTQISREAGIDPHFIESGLTESEMDTLITRAWDVAGDPAIGLKVGHKIDPKLLNMPGLYALVAPTLDIAIGRYADFIPMVWGFTMTIVENGSYVELKIDSRSVESRPYGFAKVDFQYTSIMAFMHLTTERHIRPRYMKLRRAEPDFVQLYKDQFQCPIRFSEAENVMAFSRADYQSRQVTHRPVMEPFLAAGVADLMRDLKDDSINGRVRRFLETSPDLRDVSLASLANLLAVSERTLQRRLAEEEMTFADLLDDVRRQSAMRALTLKDTNTSDLAYQLGFSSVNSFYRAFKRWTGETVERFRKSRQAE